MQNSAVSANFTVRRSFLNAPFAKSCGVPNAVAGESIAIRRSFPDAFARPWGLPNAVANLIAECSCKLRHSTQFLWYICQTLGSPNAVTSDGASWLGAVFPTHLPGPGGCRTQSQATGFHGSTQFLRCVCQALGIAERSRKRKPCRLALSLIHLPSYAGLSVAGEILAAGAASPSTALAACGRLYPCKISCLQVCFPV